MPNTFRKYPITYHVEENVKQVIEGKAAPEVLKTQSDAVFTMVTKAKMASAGLEEKPTYGLLRHCWQIADRVVGRAASPLAARWLTPS
jgi:hypothetical protein